MCCVHVSCVFMCAVYVCCACAVCTSHVHACALCMCVYVSYECACVVCTSHVCSCALCMCVHVSCVVCTSHVCVQTMAGKVLVAVCNPSLIKCRVRSVTVGGAIRVVPKGHVARVVLLLGQLGKHGKQIHPVDLVPPPPIPYSRNSCGLECRRLVGV